MSYRHCQRLSHQHCHASRIILVILPVLSYRHSTWPRFPSNITMRPRLSSQFCHRGWLAFQTLLCGQDYPPTFVDWTVPPDSAMELRFFSELCHGDRIVLKTLPCCHDYPPNSAVSTGLIIQTLPWDQYFLQTLSRQGQDCPLNSAMGPQPSEMQCGHH